MSEQAQTSLELVIDRNFEERTSALTDRLTHKQDRYGLVSITIERCSLIGDSQRVPA